MGRKVNNSVNTSNIAEQAAHTARAGTEVVAGKADEARSSAERALATRGLAPHQLGGTFSENLDEATSEFRKATRRPRKKLAANAKRTRHELRRSSADARDDAYRLAVQARVSGTKAAREVGADRDKLAKKAQKKAAKDARSARCRAALRNPWVVVPLAMSTVIAAVAVTRVLRSRSCHHTDHDNEATRSVQERSPADGDGSPQQGHI